MLFLKLYKIVFGLMAHLIATIPMDFDTEQYHVLIRHRMYGIVNELIDIIEDYQ
jgi:hypothetical protein